MNDSVFNNAAGGFRQIHNAVSGAASGLANAAVKAASQSAQRVSPNKQAEPVASHTSSAYVPRNSKEDEPNQPKATSQGESEADAKDPKQQRGDVYPSNGNDVTSQAQQSGEINAQNTDANEQQPYRDIDLEQLQKIAQERELSIQFMLEGEKLSDKISAQQLGDEFQEQLNQQKDHIKLFKYTGQCNGMHYDITHKLPNEDNDYQESVNISRLNESSITTSMQLLAASDNDLVEINNLSTDLKVNFKDNNNEDLNAQEMAYVAARANGFADINYDDNAISEARVEELEQLANDYGNELRPAHKQNNENKAAPK